MSLLRRNSGAETDEPRKKFSLGWLKRPELPEDGNMTLFEHLAELRYRLVWAAITIVLGLIVGLIFRHFLFELLIEPYQRAIALAHETRPDIVARPIFSGLTSPFTTSLKIALLGGLVLSSPFWLYQIWAFIVPGLLAKEKKWAAIVIGCATPLFVGGVALAYYVIPNTIAALLKFTPKNLGADNLQSVDEFLSLMTRIMLIFGFAFEIPLFIVLLNIVGVLPAAMISKYRSYLIFAVFVFAAVVTPSPDALTMLMLAVPMAILVVVAEVISHLLDRRKRRRQVLSGGDAGSGIAKDKALAAMEAEDAAKASGHEPVPAVGSSRPRTMAQAFGLDAGSHPGSP